MTELLDARQLKERASLVELLANLGYKPVRKSGKEQMYSSMLRDDDSNPSFAVDDAIGGWYDHGTGKGGNIIDFGLKYWPLLTFKEVVIKINEVLNGNIASAAEPRTKRSRIRRKVPHFLVAEIKRLGSHPAVTNYLKSRGVFEAGFGHLHEVYYYADGIQPRKIYFAAGWQNETGSWEVRNRYFKGCVGLKAISFIARDPKKLAVFEGCMDYLTWKVDNPTAEHSILILNSLSLLAAGIAKAKQFSSIDLYFDRDIRGHKATLEFIAALPYARDRSIVYEGFNDYNAMLVAFIRQTPVPALPEADTADAIANPKHTFLRK
ncbi:toprim domain-containing protein [Mucilaginibacter sp. SMC90]|uniref:toprim domain-containing protein n=1 Tax=Mucilaginibacter sp. SMC90 TaxID=2929803 RepID=UPI001FB1D638|nr:toprim domain-containing protein [Mucilaginibacter sp. SMC90]UOE47839.1 toprim domain-containing protein [Mucilaginibacter sp. SMC90]